MAIPASGEISFNLFNTDRGIASGTQVDIATAATAYGVSYTTNGSNDININEFYGKSVGGGGGPGPTPPTPPTPPTIYEIALCSGETGYPRTEYITILAGGTTPTNATLKFNQSYLAGCWTWVGTVTGVSVTYNDATLASQYGNCMDCQAASPPPSPPTPPTPPTPSGTIFTYTLNTTGQATANLACSTWSGANTNYYSIYNSLANGVTLFEDTGATTTPIAPDGWYSDGTNYFYVQSGALTSTPQACSGLVPPPSPPTPPTPPGPTPTPPPACYIWNVYNFDGFETVSGTYTNCSGFTDYFSFTDGTGGSGVVGTVCVQDGGSVSVTSTGIASPNGSASQTATTC